MTKNMPPQPRPISAVPSQPRAINPRPGSEPPPSILGGVRTITIIITMIGTATIPLSTALHTQHVNGVDPRKAKPETRSRWLAAAMMVLENRLPPGAFASSVACQSKCFGHPHRQAEAGEHRGSPAMPVPMMPRANSRKVKSPASRALNASARLRRRK